MSRLGMQLVRIVFSPPPFAVGEHDPEARVEGGGLDVKESDTFWHGRVALRMIEQGMPMRASGLGHPNEFRFLEPPEIQLGQTDLLLWDGRNNDDGLGFGANDGAIGAAENPDDDVVPWGEAEG